MKKLLTTLLAVLLLAGCRQQQPAPRQIVILIDMSASIEPQAETECLDAIAKLISKLERGDVVAIIPITGDADIQSAGHVLRFHKPLSRTAYDADLIGFSKQVHDSLQRLRVQAISNPTAKTDIFGAIKMALEELGASQKGRDREIILFSDFIEDDGTVNFNVDRRLATARAAERYAEEEARSAQSFFAAGAGSVRVSLGLLRSRDLVALNKDRREAIKRFWLQYLKLRGLDPTYTTDGVGLLLTSF